MDAHQLKKYLDSLFVHESRKYGHMARIELAEQVLAQKAQNTFWLHNAIFESAMCFYVETIDNINQNSYKIQQTPPWYMSFLAKISWEYLTLRAAEKTAREGYPWQAFTMLRNNFDRLVMLSACLQEDGAFEKSMGISNGSFDATKAKNLRKKFECEISTRMTGWASKLPQETQALLQTINSQYDEETHPAMLSFGVRMTEMTAGNGFSFIPEFDNYGFGLFMTRHYEILWMAHRILPAVQLSGLPLSCDWKEKWKIVDRGCKDVVGSIENQDGKKIGAAMAEFILAKFPYDQNSCFPRSE